MITLGSDDFLRFPALIPRRSCASPTILSGKTDLNDSLIERREILYSSATSKNAIYKTSSATGGFTMHQFGKQHPEKKVKWVMGHFDANVPCSLTTHSWI